MFDRFGFFFITTIPAQTKHRNFTFTVYTQKKILLSTQLSVCHPMAPAQSTLKRRRYDTTAQQKHKHPKHDIPCKKLKPAQPHTVNQQGQMSVEEVQDDMPGNHSLMHPNTIHNAANGGDELEIVDNDSQPAAPLEDVETVEEEHCIAW